MDCSFSGCSKVSFSKGLCGAHYQQARQGKQLKPLQQQFHNLSEIERLEKWTSVLPNGCWRWMGSIKSRNNRPQSEWHGQWRNGQGLIELVHRASWRLRVGEIPRDAFVLHRCDNPRCVNPEHLFIGTQADNVKDMWDKGRARPGLSRGADHGMSKLTDALVVEIRTSKETGHCIAKRLGVATSTIYDVRNRKIWKQVK